MGEAALSLEATESSTGANLRLVSDCSKQEETGKSSYLGYIVAILIVIQILDGVLTACGVTYLGIEAEGNPLLRFLMVQFGFISALVAAKGLSIVIVCLLGHFAEKVAWIEKAMAGVACLYMVAAIIPWTIILTRHLVLY